MVCRRRACLVLLGLVFWAGTAAPGGAATQLGARGAEFTLNDQPAFLLGMSYYGALGAPRKAVARDLDDLQRLGFHWIRVWATWAAFDNDVSAVDGEGRAREPFLGQLCGLVADCDRRGMVVDVTLSRGNGVAGSPRLASLEAHRRAVETLVEALRAPRNWYLDLANERNVADQRFVSFEDLRRLREAVRRLDPDRLVTASHAGDLARDDVRRYLLEVGVDFLSPHRPRHARSPQQTEAKTREYRAWMKEVGRIVPLHYQEPFRRGFTKGWEPAAGDYVADVRGARAGGAAGWCFHNGDSRGAPEGRPRRSFDLRGTRLFEQLDEEERRAAEALAPALREGEGRP
jgi:hypothetical protein